MRTYRVISLACVLASTSLVGLLAKSLPPTLTIDAGQVTAHVSPILYGLMTEEINHSYDGGLYAELVQNRTFQDDPHLPVHWTLLQAGGGAGTMALDSSQPLSPALPVSLKVTATAAQPAQRVAVANDGFWGIPVIPANQYRASFYARSESGTPLPVTVSLESNDGKTTISSGVVTLTGAGWKRYEVLLSTEGRVTPSTANRLVLALHQPGTVWLNLVSLFPPTYQGRPNGNRIDLMRLLGEMSPAFLRLPGGNYLEGDHIESRFDWKKTLGPLTERPGHPGCWSYRSSDGLGLLEFLQWCEDLKMQPVLAVYAGYSLKQEHIEPGPALQPFVQDALDEIEYVTGGPETTWGARRVKDGHPAPFPLTYVEIGNEDGFDHAKTYDGRFAQFYDAIKARYPKLQIIATAKVTSRTPDVVDDHFYRSSEAMEADAHHYDNHPRTGPKVFVGEWATIHAHPEASTDGKPTPNLDCALADAAWLTGLERNSDLVIMAAYAPLLTNVNTDPKAWQWQTNLIGYNGLLAYGSPSYYVQKMFATHLGDVVLASSLDGVPTLPASPPKKPTDKPGPPVPQVHAVVTRQSAQGLLYVKLVNTQPTPQPVRLILKGAGQLSPEATALTLANPDPKATNSLEVPTAVVPVESPVRGVRPDFAYTLPAYSVTVLTLSAAP